MAFLDGFLMLLIIIVPFLVILASEKNKFMSTMGPVFLCYLLGFLLQFLLPPSSAPMSFSEVLIPLAIPLILFGANFSQLKKLAKPVGTSMLLSVISILVISSSAFFIFRYLVDDASKISGMLVGLYTGGTPNLMAIGVALDVPETTIILTNTADLVAGGIYFLLLISIIPKIYGLFLKPFSSLAVKAGGDDDYATAPELQKRSLWSGLQDFNGITIVNFFKNQALLFLLAIIAFALSIGLALALTGTLHVAIIMLGVTSFGVVGSFFKKIRRLPGSYETGKYLILMFSFAIGLSFDLSLVTRSTLNMLIMLFYVQFGTVILHALISFIFRIDRDTTIITSTACIFGPAFIIPVADALKNKEIILPGLILGILGYAIGNYLGISLALLLNLL